MRRFAKPPPGQIAFSAPGVTVLIGFCALALTSCDFLFNPDTDSGTEGAATSLTVPPPPPGTVHAVDISFATGEITAEDVACWKEKYNVEHIMVALNWGYLDLAERQLQTVVNSGVTVDAYVWIAWTETNSPLGPERVETVLSSLVADYPVRRLWLDVEPHHSGSDSHLGPAERLPILRAAVEACGDFPCGIYTRKNWWNREIGPTTEFSHLPLWYAHYDHQESFRDWYNYPADDEDFGPFGGWSSPTGKQYDEPSSNPQKYDECKTNIDWDVMKVKPTPPSPTGLSRDGGSAISMAKRGSPTG
jgi:hypothetical protein